MSPLPWEPFPWKRFTITASILGVFEARVVPATFRVNGLGDAGSGSDDSGDLRYCIKQANANNQATRQTSRVTSPTG